MQSESPAKGRKKIKHIISEEDLEKGTKEAAKVEEERLKRIANRQKMVGKFCLILKSLGLYYMFFISLIFTEIFTSMMNYTTMFRKDLVF